MPTAPYIRMSQPGDGKTVRKLILEAAPGIEYGKAIDLSTQVGDGRQGDMTTMHLRMKPSLRTGAPVFSKGAPVADLPRTNSLGLPAAKTGPAPGEDFETYALFSMRIADSGYGRCTGFIYAGPPMNWILETRRPIPERRALAARLTEIQLMGVHEKFRRRGIASLLLADCEERYRAAGYVAALVIVTAEADEHVTAFYEKHGYLFDDVDAFPVVRYRRGGGESKVYDHIQDGQRIGFKALAEPARVGRTVTPEGRRVLLAGLLNDETPAKQGNLP